MTSRFIRNYSQKLVWLCDWDARTRTIQTYFDVVEGCLALRDWSLTRAVLISSREGKEPPK